MCDLSVIVTPAPDSDRFLRVAEVLTRLPIRCRRQTVRRWIHNGVTIGCGTDRRRVRLQAIYQGGLLCVRECWLTEFLDANHLRPAEGAP
jgi:hypothetical protein